MLGGGNPASIPAMDQYLNALWRETLDDGSMSEALCNYDGPYPPDLTGRPVAQGIRLAHHGGQSAFFYLFNLFAGRGEDGTLPRVLFPLAPEYLGYSDAGLEENMFVATKPTLSLLPEGQFKYHVDF